MTCRRPAGSRPIGVARLVAGLLLAAGCTPQATDREAADGGQTMDRIAERYVRLVLATGEHDRDYVDAYFGPEAWREEVRQAALDLPAIRAEGASALAALSALEPAADGSPEADRYRHLERSLVSLLARVDFLSGTKTSFDEESRALYDAVAPRHGAEHFQEILDRMDELLPGTGPVTDRYEAFRSEFVIPPEKLDAVFRAAVDACRARTRAYIELPAEESFTIEYVTDKSWSGYNWYQGGYKSLIQVNTDLPIYIDRALDLACHEGYPGHHVYNLLVERELAEARGWVEFAVYPLFSPRSLIAEGSANFGIEVAFPAAERIEYEREALFPLAGLDAARAEAYYELQELVRQLGYAGNEAARDYLDGATDAAGAAEWLETYALMSPARAEQRVRFIDQYRSYVINYNLGQDLVRGYVEAEGGTPDRPERRWEIFTDLLSRPALPSDLGS